MKANLPPRRLIPRWRRTKSVLHMPEATFSNSNVKHDFAFDPDHFDQALELWRSTPTTGVLGDVLSYSVDPALRTRIVDWLRRDISTKRVATATQADFIEQLAGDDLETEAASKAFIPREDFSICNPAIRREVSTLRQVLRANPANPLALLDVAQFQLANGHTKQAERSVLTALSLSPNNRIALRTLARLYVHKREFDKAHSLISRHSRTKTDPWLMATEIALAEVAGTGSKFAKDGSRFAREKKASNAHLSELAGALGSSELQFGNVKRAREMFRLALLAPNDNVVAQAVTEQKMLGIELSGPVQQQAVMSAHEAQTLLGWNALDQLGAERHALIWHDEEPFSSRPLQFLTTLYAAQRDYASAMMLARRGLVADPTEPSLLSNLAYVSACSGNLDEAEKILTKLLALKLPNYTGVILATAGLMQMKEGFWAQGDEFYEAAMRKFRERREFVQEALCSAYFARSAADTNHPRRDEILRRAQANYSDYPSPDAAIVLSHFDISVQPEAQTNSSRRLSQWVFDSKTESLIQIHGVTEPGAPALIVRN